MNLTSQDQKYIELAIQLAENCPPVSGAFSVGAVILSENGEEIARGFSRELGATYHAEESAILKAQNIGVNLKNCTIYSSMEPCGERLSGKKTCCDHIIDSGLTRVVYAWEEPSKFVEPCGVRKLKQAGIQVDRVIGYESAVQKVNAHLLP